MSDFSGTEHYREKADEYQWLYDQGYKYTSSYARHASDVTALCDHVEDQDKEIEKLREENDWMRRWMGEFGYTEAFEGWKKFKTPAPDDEEEE